jgi:hypothetical protein
VGQKAADLKEFWQIGPERAGEQVQGATEPANVWPHEPAEFRSSFLQLYRGLQETGRLLLEALAPALQLPEGFFSRMVDDGNSVLRLIHYPPVPADAEGGSLRSAPHEDINLLTLLVAAQGPGLELLDRDGVLVELGAPEHPLVVPPFAIIGMRRSVSGSMIGGIPETQEMLDFCAEHGIAAEVEVIEPDYINEAYERVIASDVRYRFVIDTGSLRDA